MNRKGFTLMELLLVVAVLAIVAAAAAPTFFGGAKEAMDEARKSSFMSAYQNTISGANLLMGIAASQGNLPTSGSLLTFTSTDGQKNLADYAPLAARTFTNKAGNPYVFTASYDGKNVIVEYTTGNTEPSSVPATTIDVVNHNTVNEALEAVWTSINPTN